MPHVTMVPNWSELKPDMAALGKAELIDTIKDLAAFSAENRLFLAARSRDEALRRLALEEYRWRIVEQFYPDRGFPKLGFGEVRRAIRDWRKATGDVGGTTDLMLSVLEAGVELANEMGGLDEPYFKSLTSMLDELIAILRRPESEKIRSVCRARLVSIERTASDQGVFNETLRERLAELGLPAADE
jgi:hypothetical protein